MPVKPTQIHIVWGTQGEYEDRSEWIVAVYFDEELADKHAEQLRSYITDCQDKVDKAKDKEKVTRRLQDKGNPYDPKNTDSIYLDSTDYWTNTDTIQTKIKKRR